MPVAALLHMADRGSEGVERLVVAGTLGRGELADSLQHRFVAAQASEGMRGVPEACILAAEHLVAERRPHHAQKAAAELQALARGMSTRSIESRGKSSESPFSALRMCRRNASPAGRSLRIDDITSPTHLTQRELGGSGCHNQCSLNGPIWPKFA